MTVNISAGKMRLGQFPTLLVHCVNKRRVVIIFWRRIMKIVSREVMKIVAPKDSLFARIFYFIFNLSVFEYALDMASIPSGQSGEIYL